MAKLTRYEARLKRHRRVRKSISGTPEKPRLNVFKSNKNIFCQIIDDLNGRTLVSASTLDPDLKELRGVANIDASKEVGKLIAKRAIENKIENVVFDRGGYQYHGRVKALAEAAREGGLKF